LQINSAFISRAGIDMLIIRENTEGLYQALKIEMMQSCHHGTCHHAQRFERSSQAFDLQDKRIVSLCMSFIKQCFGQTCGCLFGRHRNCTKKSEIKMQEMLVDTCAMELSARRSQFEVIVTTNLFGDISATKPACSSVTCVANFCNSDGFCDFEPVT